MRIKRNKEEIKIITEKISELILMGFSREQIFNFLKKNYNLDKKRTVMRYIKGARELIDEISKKSLEEFRNEALARYYRLIKICEENGDYKTILAIQSRIDKITGIETYIIKQNIFFEKKEIEDFVKDLING